MDKTELIRKVLMNEASPEEQNELNAWRANHPDHEEEYADLKTFYSREEDNTLEPDTEDFYVPLKRIQASIKKRQQEKRRIEGRRTISLAAAIMMPFLLLVAYLVYQQSGFRNAPTGSEKTLLTELSFNDTPVGTILKTLGEENQVIFTTSSQQLLSCRFTGTFSKGLSLEEVVSVLAESENFQYAFTPGQIILTGKGCHTQL